MQPYQRTRETREKNARITGAVATLAVHALAAAVLLTSGLTYLDPPPPERSSLVIEFEEEDLDDRDLVFAATNDSDLNAQIAEKCRKKGIPVNVSSDRQLCDFYFPGIVKQGNTVIGVSASGEDHKKARRVRERIEGVLTEEGI